MRTEGQLKHVLSLQAQKQGSYLVVFTVIMVIIALGVVVGAIYLRRWRELAD